MKLGDELLDTRFRDVAIAVIFVSGEDVIMREIPQKGGGESRSFAGLSKPRRIALRQRKHGMIVVELASCALN